MSHGNRLTLSLPLTEQKYLFKVIAAIEQLILFSLLCNEDNDRQC